MQKLRSSQAPKTRPPHDPHSVASEPSSASARMHRALCIPEIVTLILLQIQGDEELGSVDRWTRKRRCRDIYNLLLTCKGFKELALSVLWSDLPTQRSLPHLLPEDSLHRTASGRMILTRALRPSDLTLMRSRVRRTKNVYLEQAGRFDSPQALIILRDIIVASPALFSSLQSLIVDDIQVVYLGYLVPLLAEAPLQNISVRVRPPIFGLNHDSVPSHTKEEAREVVDLFLGEISRRCAARLQKFKFNLDSEIMGRRALADLIEKCEGLQYVELGYIGIPRIIRALGRLPGLKHLRCSPSAVGYVDSDDEGSGAREQTPFPHLLSLHLDLEDCDRGFINTESPDQLLKGTGCFPQRALTLQYPRYPHDLFDHLDALFPLGSAQHELEEFSFVLDPPNNGHDSDEPVFMWPAPRSSHDYDWAFRRMLSPEYLFRRRNLVRVVIRLCSPLDIDDDQLVAISHAWPLLQELELDTGMRENNGWLSSPRASLEGVACLGRCRHLQRLQLIFRAKSNDNTLSLIHQRTEEESGGSSWRTDHICTSLTHLSVGLSPINPQDTFTVATYLKSSFPNLQYIQCRAYGDSPGAGELERESTELWAEVQAYLRGDNIAAEQIRYDAESLSLPHPILL